MFFKYTDQEHYSNGEGRDKRDVSDAKPQCKCTTIILCTGGYLRLNTVKDTFQTPIQHIVLSSLSSH